MTNTEPSDGSHERATQQHADTRAGHILAEPSPLHERLGIEIVEARPSQVVGRMPVEGNTQPYGLLHGGASCVLVEGLASYGATLHASTVSPHHVALGVDINATHHRAVRSGWVTGVATAVHLGRRATSYEVVIRDEQDRRVCSARITCLLGAAAGATDPE